MFKHCYLSLFLIITFLVTTHAQIILTGKVTDVNCEPLEYVEVSANGVAVGATTDSLGNYQLWLPNDSTRLITCRYFTYGMVKVLPDKQKVLDIMFFEPQGVMLEVLGIRATPTKTLQLGASKWLNSHEFNQGAIDNPLQLIQGKVAGLDIQRIGGNPNTPLTMRLRGLNSVNAFYKPLIIIDNVPNMRLESIYPDDIESIEILKDGKFCDFGLEAMGGAIAIQTKKAHKGVFGRNFTVDYKQNVSFDFLAHRFKTLDITEFVATGGQNFNENTDWIQTVTRTGFAQRHHLGMGRQGKNYSVQAALHYRNVNGILINNDFNEYGYRINADYNAFNQRLTLNCMIAQNKYQRNVGFDEAFRYATIFNPTIPKQLPNGTYQEIRTFDTYNPLAIVKQHWNRKVDRYHNLQFEANYKFYDYFKINLLANSSKYVMDGGKYSMKASWYNNLSGNGYGVQQMEENSQVFLNCSLDYQRLWGNQTITATIGSRARSTEYNINSFEKSVFLQDVSTIAELAQGQQTLRSMSAHFFDQSNIIYSRFKYDYKNRITTSLGLARVNSILFGSVQEVWSPQWNANWLIIKNNAFINELHLRVGIGRGTNQIPFFSLFSLRPEVKTEINTALDFQIFGNRLSGSLAVFKNEIKSLKVWFPSFLPNEFPIATDNSKLQNNGIELDLNYKILKINKLQWEATLQMSAVRTQISDGFNLALGEIGDFALGNTRFINTIMGKPIGQISVFQTGNVVDGLLEGRDLNGDGRLDHNDKVTAGQGLPSFVLNWSNQLNYKQFGLTVVGRGAFGHSLVNAYRANYEQFGSHFAPYYNRIRTSKANPEILFRFFPTDDLVENASFFTLEHIALSYTMNHFPCHYKWKPNYVKLLLTAHHLWTFTNYTGVSPEVRYEDTGVATRNLTQPPLAPGIEHQNIYFPTRSISIGLNVGF